MYFIMFYSTTLVVFSFCSQFLATELNEVVDLNCLFELPDAHQGHRLNCCGQRLVLRPHFRNV